MTRYAFCFLIFHVLVLPPEWLVGIRIALFLESPGRGGDGERSEMAWLINWRAQGTDWVMEWEWSACLLVCCSTDCLTDWLIGGFTGDDLAKRAWLTGVEWSMIFRFVFDWLKLTWLIDWFSGDDWGVELIVCFPASLTDWLTDSLVMIQLI